jgi:hypothetical protein
MFQDDSYQNLSKVEHYFKAFCNEKHFEKQPMSHSQTRSNSSQWTAIVRRLYGEEGKFSFFMNTIKFKKNKCILYICLAIFLKNNF